MDDPARIDFHDYEDINDLEEGRALGKEVTCPDLFAVIAHESVPGLIPTGFWPAADHIATNCTGRVLDSKLGGKFFGDLVFAPLRVVA